MLETLTQRTIEQQWTAAAIVRVAMYVDGRSWIEPMPAVYTPLGLIVGATAPQRARLARADGRVCVQADDGVDANDWTSVMAWATPRFPVGAAEVEARTALRDRVAWSSALRAALAIEGGAGAIAVVLLRFDDESGRRQRSGRRATAPRPTEVEHRAKTKEAP